MIRDILVNVSVGIENDPATAYGVSLAAAFDAHATGIAFSFDPLVVASVFGNVPAEYIESQRAESDRQAAAAKDHFDRAATLAGISRDSHIFSTGMAGAADRFSRLARRFDISVVRQVEPETGGPEELIAESVLFQSGRPVIVVPYIQKGGFTAERVMVCWDGGRAATRAVSDALPVLKKAKQVDVVIISGEEGKGDELAGADIGEHLSRHGLKVEVKSIVADGEVQSTLLSHAADTGADLLVMGGYGHSRLREFILGGVTRGILGSMTIPCLMSH